jgi:hypothetical protein
MVVEVYLKDKVPIADERDLPDTLLELEMVKGEMEVTISKLRESTDLLVEEFRAAQGDEAREYYEYVQDNLAILEQKSGRLHEIETKINMIRGIFPKKSTGEDSSESSVEGHFI